jgi:hypothetical protein
LSRIVISADRVVGRPPHDRSGVSLGVGGALTDLSRLGVGNGREDGTVLGKHLDQFLSVKRQREMVAVFCDYGLDEGPLGARSTDRRV